MLWRVLGVTLLLAPATAPATLVQPKATVRVHVFGAGGPPRSSSHQSPLANVSVRVTRSTAAPVVEARTKSNGIAVFHLKAGSYWINGYLTPPAVTPERPCEKRRVKVRPGRDLSVNIFCSLR
jgi:hypothetical protein